MSAPAASAHSATAVAKAMEVRVAPVTVSTGELLGVQVVVGQKAHGGIADVAALHVVGLDGGDAVASKVTDTLISPWLP